MAFTVQPPPQLENILWWSENILGEGGKRVFGRQKYTKYNKIHNNSENFRGQDCCQGARLLPGGFAPGP